MFASYNSYACLQTYNLWSPNHLEFTEPKCFKLTHIGGWILSASKFKPKKCFSTVWLMITEIEPPTKARHSKVVAEQRNFAKTCFKFLLVKNFVSENLKPFPNVSTSYSTFYLIRTKSVSGRLLYSGRNSGTWQKKQLQMWVRKNDLAFEWIDGVETASVQYHSFRNASKYRAEY